MTKTLNTLVLIGMMMTLFFTVGCGNQGKGPEMETATTVPTLAVSPIQTTPTVEFFEPTTAPPTATDLPLITVTPSETVNTQPAATALPATETVLPTQVNTTQQTVQVFLVAIEGNQPGVEKFGCDDQLVAVDIVIEPTVAVLRAAMTALISMDSDYYGQSGLYNALYQSDLTIEKIDLQNGLASIYFTGDLLVGGVCDNPRIQAQLEQTALQFSTVNQAKFYINGTLLEDYLSLK